jgi:hypothetical protein
VLEKIQEARGAWIADVREGGARVLTCDVVAFALAS